MKKWSRNDWLKNGARGGALLGIIGLCVALNAREEKFKCDTFCGRCAKNSDGVCSLGLK